MQITEVPGAGIQPSVIIGFDLSCDKERIGSFQAMLQAHIWHEFPVAHSSACSARRIGWLTADITLERRDALTCTRSCVAYPVTNHSLRMHDQLFCRARRFGRAAVASSPGTSCIAGKLWKAFSNRAR